MMYIVGNLPLLQWALVISHGVILVTTTITIDVTAWTICQNSLNNRGHRPSSRTTSHRRTTSLPLYRREGKKENHRKSQKNDRQRQQNAFFFNATGLYYVQDNDEDTVVTNNTIVVPSLTSPSVENVGSVAGSFGDIMSPTVDDAGLLFKDGLVTSETYSLEEFYGISNPLDRMAVTANGNLQRLFSSYYDSPVVVEMVHCTKQKQPDPAAMGNRFDNAAVWNRRVLLKIFGNQTICTADSVIQVHSCDVEDLVESKKVGIGQIFRHFNILPQFNLLVAGPTVDGGFWRNYTLESDIVTCTIREVFCKNVWELSPATYQGDE